MSRSLRLITIVYPLAIWAWIPQGAAGAEEPVPPPAAEPPHPSVDDRLEELDQRQRILERKLELEKDAAVEKAKDLSTVSVGKDGFRLKSATGDYQLRIGALLHADARLFVGDETPNLNDTFVMRRVRPIFQGTLFKYLDFFLMPDFGDGKAVLQDAYLDLHYWDWLRLRAGKMKEPVGLERLVSASQLLFVERALPTAVAPNRDVGVQLHGETLEGVLGYGVGYFNGVADGSSADVDANDDKDVAARVFVHPFKPLDFEPLQGLGIGVSGTYGNQEGTLPSYRTAGQNTFFTTVAGVAADGIHRRISPQAYWYWGPFGVLTEYIASTQDLTQAGVVRPLDTTAWQVALSWVVTGEKASYKSFKPKKPFDPFRGDWGALELAARWSELHVGDDAFDVGVADRTRSAERAREWAVGFNWHLTDNFKFTVDYIRTEFKGGAPNGDDRETENAVVGRFQVAF